MALAHQKMQKLDARGFNTFAMKIKAGVGFGLATVQFLRSAAIK